MSVKWIKTPHRGLRYYEHPTRKHGKKRDRYYSIRFKVDNHDYDYGIGWWSDGIPEEIRKSDPRMNFEEYALIQLKTFKANTRIGSGAKSPKEKRKIEDERELREKAEIEQQAKEAITFGVIFEDQYTPIAKANKVRGAWRSEDGIFRNWLNPVLGHLPLKDVSPIHLERIKKNMTDAGRAASTIRYALAIIRQVYNFAQASGNFIGDNPVGKVKKPSSDNRRLRFLSHAEADSLLKALRERSQDVHDMALLSLHCGLRAGEVFSLTWGDVDAERGMLTLRDTKSGKSRHGFMTDAVKKIFSGRLRGKQNDLVFPIRRQRPSRTAQETAILKTVALQKQAGAEKVQASKTFNRTVDDLKFNDGVTDRRQKVVWHTLRHTCASWLVESGVDLFVVKEILGHSVIAMTERYSHLSPGTLQNATRILEKGIEAARKPVLELRMEKNP